MAAAGMVSGGEANLAVGRGVGVHAAAREAVVGCAEACASLEGPSYASTGVGRRRIVGGLSQVLGRGLAWLLVASGDVMADGAAVALPPTLSATARSTEGSKTSVEGDEVTMPRPDKGSAAGSGGSSGCVSSTKLGVGWSPH
jgi:hypothetical protein